MIEFLINELVKNIILKYNDNFKKNTEERISKLREMKQKVKSSPNEVELWIEEEISKIEKIDLSEEIKNHLDIKQ